MVMGQIQEKTKTETSGRTTRDIINVEFLAHVLCDLVCDLEARFAEFESSLSRTSMWVRGSR